ncbi:Phasin family protein [Methylocella tundrae]|uniref:Phasin family protein n=1 Tax=Methylocella tundrae TaxID=227605 RepID=A0A4U8YXI5_METTU|nr:phasin family protein [Methylocella tundrae]WPP06071.1 phasin family protein [Methylocella tundrae]VFU08672.1 Phasin family protein [Methylocella tundrae]VTZ26475.1 Phasin family protein [Methylocella tundrae]VTZ48590.1 Phasin family protein [Methylocella tundrae]
MSDINLKDANAAADLSASTLSSTTKNLQAFAAEIAEMSRQSIEHTTDTIEKLRNARGLSEILTIQTNFMREAFEHLSQHTRKFSELMTSLPLEMSKTYAQLWTKSLDSGVRTVEEAGEKAAANVERLSQTYRNP